VKRFTAILLLLTLLLSRTELYQLCKLPKLITHYMEHKHENPAINLWDFLDMHYAHGDVMDADYDKDMQLPFKTNEYTGEMATSIYTSHAIESFTIEPPVHARRLNEVTDYLFIPLFYAAKIFQPPRVA
jgi:hypothetical protein